MRLFPQAQPRPTHSHAELTLYAALSKAALSWTAFHSLRLRSKEGWEGEGDFVIADPSAGLLVLEVKGGNIELRDGRWSQNGKPMSQAPRDQALGFVKHLIEELKRAGCETPPFGVACVFPDCDFSAAPSNGDLRGLVLGRRELPHLESVLPEVFRLAVPAMRVPQSRKWLEQLKSLWGDSWVPSVNLGDRVDESVERSVALDTKQYQLLELAGGTARALVEGPAGSGKTLVATELCRRRAAAGQTTLYLCFTDALARAVQAQFEGTPRLRATSVRQLAVDLLKGSGANIPPPDKKFWDEVSLNATCEALPIESARPDLVVVDEGQDFDPGDWMLAEQLAGPRGLWVFRDRRQAFWTDRALPESLDATLGGRFTLGQSYRCPSGLAVFAESYVDPTASRALPAAEVLKRVVCDEDEVGEKVRHEVESLLKQGARPNQIVVVSLSGQSRSKLFGLSMLGSTPVVHADSPEAGHRVVVETFLRFKGLERPFVIITELGGKHVTHYDTRMHIALTRATVQAIVIADRQSAQADARLS
ncbi:MAG: NERD domain-containing protein [Archangium sp.]|nr:NERD domain-containing protein [Archangium sp.]MDP3575359.1 NERD domain-containing protein [Archangium sp.]